MVVSLLYLGKKEIKDYSLTFDQIDITLDKATYEVSMDTDC